MSHAQAQTHALMGALSLAGQLVARRQNLQHEKDLATLRSGTLAHLVDALVTGRAELVSQGFTQVLAQYAEQARHLMDQQKSYAERELDSADPLRRIEIRSRVQKLDVELALIRADARLLYDRMTEVILALGGSTMDFVTDVAQPLGFPELGHVARR